jgi:putative transport protein
MDWISMLPLHGAAQAVVVLGLAISAGLAFGHIRFAGIRLGVGGVLFSGLALGHAGLALDPAILEFVREFGLILFVFTIGMQVGPGFFDSLRRQGFALNLLAAGVVVLGTLLAVGFHLLGGLPVPLAAGLLSGATTNTPSLAAASQALREVAPAVAEAAVEQAGLGYAVAYPFGIFGIILAMLLVRRVFRIDPDRELRELEAQTRQLHPPLEAVTMVVDNPNLDGLPLSRVPGLQGTGVVVSRVLDAAGPGDPGEVRPPTADLVLRTGMLLHAVGQPAELDRLRIVVGRKSDTDLGGVPGPLTVRRFLLTRKNLLGLTLLELRLRLRHGVTVTRITRSGTEFSPGPRIRLHLGDTIQVVGRPEDLAEVERVVGNSTRDLNIPDVLPVFVGIILGTLLGSLPLPLPGLPSGVKLGLAGGPLLAAILLSRLHHFGGLVWYMPTSANLVLRELGISLFLACIGLKAGGGFVQAVLSGDGLLWLAVGACLTFVPMLAAGLAGRLVLKLDYASLCGLLAGSMTDPPALAFAGQMLRSDLPSSVYATVYPLVMVLRILAGQLLVLLLY